MLKRLSIILVSVLVLSAAALYAQTTPTPENAASTTNSGTEKKVKKPVFRSTKDQVKQAQTMLISSNAFKGEATGKSSAEWKAAVKSYQGDNGLAKTGSLNRATLEKMGIELTDKQKEIPVNPKHFASSDAKATKTSAKADKDAAKTDAKSSDGPKRPAPFQATADQITELQNKLKGEKLFAGAADGKRSNELKDAVKKYQEASGLKATGGVNAATLEKAGIALTDKQKEQVAAQAAYDAAKAAKN